MKVLLLFLLSLSAFANDAILSICVSSPTQLPELKKHIEFLKTPGDKVNETGSCVDVKTQEVKVQLYTKYIEQRMPTATINDLSLKANKEMCHLTLIKKHRTKGDQQTYGLNNKGRPSLIDSQRKSKGQETMSVVTMVGEETFMGEFNKEFHFICYKRRDHYKITLVSHSNNFSLKSEVQVYPGRETFVGSYTKSDKTNAKDLGLSRIKVSKGKINKTVDLYLTARKL